MTENNIDELISELRDNSGIEEVRKVNGNTVRFDIPHQTYGNIDLPKFEYWCIDSVQSYTDVMRFNYTYVR